MKFQREIYHYALFRFSRKAAINLVKKAGYWKNSAWDLKYNMFCLLLYIAVRIDWRPEDPEIVSDVLFAVANVMSIARTTYMMPAFEVLGPLQISLGRMLGDITRFLVLFTLVTNYRDTFYRAVQQSTPPPSVCHN